MIRIGLTVLLAAGGLVDDAAARPSGPQGSPPEVQAADQGRTIIVTGSRIERAGVERQEPVVSLERDYLEARNLTNLADALNELPGFRNPVTPNGVQENYGQGVNFVNAFGLGSHRTLTLLNGRRVVSSNVPTIFGQASPGGQVDLNMIPTILVGRVDRVAIGGAPVYGSDAVAGTVNVILRDDVDGLELAGTTGITGSGDNFRYNLSGAYGAGFAGGRGRFTMALSHDKVRGVRQSARRIYRDGVMEVPNIGMAGAVPLRDGRLNPGIGYDTGPDDGAPASVLVRDGAIPFLTEGGMVFGGQIPGLFRFDPAGELVPFRRGNAFGPFQSGGDGMRLGDYGQITSDLDRFSAFAQGEYDLDGNLRLFAEAQFFRSRADEIVDQPNYNALLFSGVSGPLLFTASNPFLTPQAQGVLLANNAPFFVLSRASADIGDPTGHAVNKVARGVLGLKGDLDLGGRAFRFELAASYGRSNFTDYDQQIDQQRFVNAINVKRQADGRIVCDPAPMLPAGGAPAPDPACRPLNLFGAGAPSAEALNYVLADVKARSRMTQFVVGANIGGAPFSIFGNQAALNIGFEHRSEKARFTPDAFQRAGLGRSTPVLPVAGGFKLNEVHGELLLPLLAPANNAPLYALDVFARARFTHSSVNGGFTSWTAGARLVPVKGLALRGNFTRSFRSPAIAELFTPGNPAREFVPDLCSTANRNAGPNPGVRSRNCAAFLDAYPLSTPLTASFVNVPALTGGNRNLANEKADSFTFGLAIDPDVVPGLTVSADWLDVRISDPIALLTVADLASACFDNPQFDLADPARGNAFCAAIGRDALGQVLADPLAPAVRTTFVNGRRIRFSGLEATLGYATALDRISLPGKLSFAANLFHVHRRTRNITGVATDRLDGLVDDPAWQGQLRIAYGQQRWGLAAHINYTGKQLFGRFGRSAGPNDTREIDHLNPFATIDGNLYAMPLEGFQLNLAVTNLTNRQGQRYYGYVIPASINDPLGRRFTLSVAKAF